MKESSEKKDLNSRDPEPISVLVGVPFLGLCLVEAETEEELREKLAELRRASFDV